FRRPRSITSVIAWMMTLVFLPGIGFILYAFCGRGIDGETVYLLSEKQQRRIKEINEIIEKNNNSFPERMVNEETYLLEDYLQGIGFILYSFCGRGIEGETVYLLSEKHQRRIKEINEIIENNNHSFPVRMANEETYLLEDYLQGMDVSPITLGNQLTFFTDGKEKFNHLFEDIRKAEDNVHVEYYAFFDDRIGNKFLDVLVEKAQEGVE